jgi:oxygen-independent coproporphyrinogen-3 oxidase
MVRDIFFKARKIGIEIINIDLVAGLPGQTVKSFLKDLNFILKLKPDAIHLYPYEEEDLVVFYRIGKKLKPKDKILKNKMLKLADKKIKEYGYQHYRNEPYLLSSKAANLQFQFRYFSNGSLLGLGAEALSYIPNHFAYENSKLEEYLNYKSRKDFPRYLNGHPLTKKETQLNYVLNNIRAGINKKNFFELYGLNFDKVFGEEIDSLQKIRKIEENGQKIRLVAKNNFEFRTYSK